MYTGPRTSRESVQLRRTILFLVSAVSWDIKGEKISFPDPAFWAKISGKIPRRRQIPVNSRLLIIDIILIGRRLCVQSVYKYLLFA
jgi:hypothetical protein